jgi:PST family polysaccharide transporter
MQTLFTLPLLLASLGVGVALVRMVARASSDADDAAVAAIRRSAWLVRAGISGTAIVVIVLLRGSISRLLFGDARYATAVAIVGLALGFSLASDLQTSSLNAYRRISALAKVAILSALIGTASSLGIIWVWRTGGIAPAILANAAIGWIVATYFVRRQIPRLAGSIRPSQVLRSAGSLVRFGGPYTASILVGSGVQSAMPLLVMQALGTKSVGFYQAAATIAVTYMGFLLIAMGQEYYPRLSAASLRPATVVDLINQQQRLVLVLTTPLIFFLLALAPYLIPVIYSAEFAPAFRVLQWQLLGDILKFSSWTMSFAVLATSGSMPFFLMELVAGVIYLAASWLGMHLLGLQGLGMSWLALYAAYFGAAWLVVRRTVPLVWTSQNRRMMGGAMLMVLIVGVASIPRIEALRLACTLACALAASVVSWQALRNELGEDLRWRRVAAWLRSRTTGERQNRFENQTQQSDDDFPAQPADGESD